MVFINRFILISLLVSCGFLYGVLLFLSDYEENKCEMTYMFQYPQFVRISMKIDDQFKRYGLYSYSEGHFTEKARKKQFHGIPVLFIPGNAGSFKQVRSLASIALRKALDSRPGFHFDYFTIDFNEELSGLNGVLLHDQVLYARQSIYRILQLYASNTNKPTSVVLVGHSMGGIVAEGLLSKIPNNIIPLVITLSSPHKRPPLFFDNYLYDFYRNIRMWNNQNNTTFITVFGGFSDFLVAPHLTSSKHLNVVTTHIPKTWLPTDHLCILWCKQLVLVLNRALFDCVDPVKKQISKDKEYMASVFKHHLLHNSGIKVNLRNQYDELTPIDDKGEWIERLPRQYSVELTEGSKIPSWYMVRRINQSRHEILSIMAINLEVTNWIYVCSASVIKGHSRVCIDAMHLSHLSEIVPSHRYKRRFLNINMHQLNDTFTHVIAKVPATSESVALHVDLHSEADRKLIASLPVWSLKNNVIIEETSPNTLYYEIHFPDLYHVVQSYQLFVVPIKCAAQNHHTTISLSVPWSNLDQHVILTESQNKPMNLRLYSNKPSDASDSSPFVRLLLDPNCKYTVSVKISIPNMFAQFVRFYSPLIYGNVVVIVLLSLESQLFNIAENGKWSLFFTALMTDTKPYYIIPVTKVAVFILGSSLALKVLPSTDTQILDEEGVGFVITILLYLLSIGIVWILTIILAISIFWFESTVHKIFLRIIARAVPGTMATHDWVLKGLKRIPTFVAVLLISLSISTCGGLALCIGLIFYFLKLTQIAQDVVESIIMNFIKAVASKLKFKPKTVDRFRRMIVRSSRNPTKVRNEIGSTSTNEQNETDENKEGGNVGVGNVEVSNVEVSNVEVSNVEVSNAEVSNTEVSNVEASNVEANSNVPDKSNSSTSNVSDRENNEQKIQENLRFETITDNNELYFHFTMFCLWFLVTCINVPIVLTWAHNFVYTSKLDADPSFIPGCVLCTCALVLWQFKFPLTEKKWYKEMGYIVYILAVYSFIYGTFSIYRLNYVLTCVIALITLHQLLAPNKVDVRAGDNLSNDDSYEKVKVKLE